MVKARPARLDGHELVRPSLLAMVRCGMKPSDFRERVREAEQQAGAIPRDVFAWHLWQRFWDRELSLGGARELLGYFEKLYLAPPST